MRISAHQEWKRVKQSKAEQKCAALVRPLYGSAVPACLGLGGKELESGRSRLGTAGSSRRPPLLRSGRWRCGQLRPLGPRGASLWAGWGVGRRTCGGPSSAALWPGLPRRLTVRSVLHHGEAGQSGGEYPVGKTVGRRGTRRQESGAPCSSRRGLRVSGGAWTSSRATQLPPSAPAPDARAPRTQLAPLGPPLSPPSFLLSRVPRFSQPFSRTFWQCSLAPFPPALGLAVASYWSHKGSRSSVSSCMFVLSLRPPEAPGLAHSSESPTLAPRPCGAHAGGMEAWRPRVRLLFNAPF